MKRNQLWVEYNHKKAQRIKITQAKSAKTIISTSEKRLNDIMNLGETNNETISCGLYHTRGHTQNKCDRISDYGNSVLPSGNTQIRQALVGNFYSTIEGLVCRRVDNERLLLTTVPSKVKGVIIHRRIIIKNDLIDPMVITNICL